MEHHRKQAGILLEISTPKGVRRLHLGAEPISLGRHVDNKINLDDQLASRFHCIIGLKKGKVFVRDLDSSNGTFINGKRISVAELGPQDVMTVGTVQVKILGPGAPLPAPANPASAAPAAKVAKRDTSRPLMEEIKAPAPLNLDGPPPASPDEAPDIFELEAAASSLESADAVDELGDDDIVEEIGEDDIIPEATLGGAWAEGFSDKDNRGPISIEDPNEVAATYDVNADKVLADLAASLPDRTFTDSEIALLSARGQMIHPAARATGGAEALVMFRRLLLVSTRCRATDIHIEPRDGGYQARMRVDGTMIDIVRTPTPQGIRLLALVKVLSEIDLSQRHSIQEGHFTTNVPSDRIGTGVRRIDYRVSFAPSVFGQKLVMRVLDTSSAPLHVKSLNLPEWMQSDLEKAIKQDAGMILVCGPTGSGKTTTLYALVRGSNVRQRNVITIEDPVEIQLEAVTQIPVDDEHGKSFANLLRSVLRQDPDVILIGEIRDAETARIAMQAAVTGHLVFSTIHTRDTAGTIFRLLDLGVEPYLVAQALHLVLAQRLIRQLCPSCKKPTKVTPEQLAAMGPAGKGVTKLYNAVGCAKCLGTGHWGRRAFFEMMTANDALRDVIVNQPTMQRISAALAAHRFQSLQHSAFELVASGLVAFSEVDRVMGGRDLEFKE